MDSQQYKIQLNSKFNLENERRFIMSEFEKYMENRNVIDRVQHTNVTKKELISLIDKAFPDEEVGNHGQIAQITTTEMTDGTKMQSICFGKIFEVQMKLDFNKQIKQ